MCVCVCVYVCVCVCMRSCACVRITNKEHIYLRLITGQVYFHSRSHEVNEQLEL